MNEQTVLFDLLKEGVSPAHVVKSCEKRLEDAGFEKIAYEKEWNLKTGGRYYVDHHDTTLFAFTIPEDEMKKEEKFCLTERILDALDESISLVFLANPNNPVGNLVEPELIFKIAEKCRQCDITLVLDECFMELTGKEQKYSFLSYLEEFPNVVVVRAFTKLYAIPGVRLGYLVCLFFQKYQQFFCIRQDLKQF